MPTVSGRCVDASGAPAPGVYVYARAAEGSRFGQAPAVHTRRDGSWSLELPPGQWTVRETGHAVHEVNVGELAIDLTTTGATSPGPVPTRDDLARLFGRRRSTREDA